MIAGTTSLLVLGVASKWSYLPWALGITILLAGLWVFDVPSQGKYWTPFRVLKTRDTRYGRLQLVQAGEQLSLYSNNVAQFSRPDPGAAEESVHFAMLQNPAARRVLLIGGGADGTLIELLKYAEAEIDYVELDPEIVRLVERFLGEEERQSLAATRVRTKFQDGRAFLRTTRERYEIILLNLPEPSTAQVNRFYTLEFFALARRHLRPGGILSFPVLSSETAIGPELQQLLSSLRFTLSKVFSQVRIVPGERSVFLASDAPMTIDPDELGRRIDTLRLSTRYLDARSLRSRLHALRVAYLEEKIAQGPQRLNSDFAPVGFFLSTSLWSTQFRGSGAPILRFLSRVPVAWLLGVPLLLFAGLLLALRATTGEGTFSLLPLVIMGLTTIVAEIVLLVWFQARYGFLYGRIALLVSTFMLGLFLGSLWAGRVKSPSYRWLAAFQAGLLALLGLFRLTIPAELPEATAYLLLLCFGLLGGGLFIVSNRVYLRVRKDYGRGYGLELAGSFLGALLTSSLFIPLAGLVRVIDAVILLNVMGLLFLVSRPKRRGPLPV
jgi:spermidine synthase